MDEDDYKETFLMPFFFCCPLQEISSMAGSAAVVEGSGEAEAMEQGDSEAVAMGEEPMQTEGELGEGAIRVVAIEEGAAGEAGTMLRVHVAMEAQPGQGEQAEVGMNEVTRTYFSIDVFRFVLNARKVIICFFFFCRTGSVCSDGAGW